MMAKMMYVLGFLSLSAAGGVFTCCGRQWTRPTPEAEETPAVSLKQRYQALQEARTQSDASVEPPLVAQARAFALYLDPPKPSAPKPVAPSPQPVAAPIPSPVRTAPNFRLLSISYYRSQPEKSLALVSEPGKGGHWVKKGDRLGHLVIEEIKPEAIVYREGSQSHEMAIVVKNTVQLAQRKSAAPVSGRSPASGPTSVSSQNIRPDLRFLNAAQARR